LIAQVVVNPISIRSRPWWPLNRFGFNIPHKCDFIGSYVHRVYLYVCYSLVTVKT